MKSTRLPLSVHAAGLGAVVVFLLDLPYAWAFAAAFYGYSFLRLRMGGSGIGTALYACLALSIPTSFRSLSGGDYGSLPLSWFNLIFLAIIAFAIIGLSFSPNGRIKKAWPLAAGLTLFLAAVFLSLLDSKHLSDGLKYFLTFASALVLVYIATCLDVNHAMIRAAYLSGAAAIAIAVVLQYVLMREGGVEVGRIVHYPARVGLGATYWDFSFLSLYLATGTVIALFSYRRFMLAVLLLAASILCSARTGIAAFAVTMGAQVFIGPYKRGIKVAMFIGLTVFLAGAVTLFSLTRGGENLFSDNGRFATYASGLDNIRARPAFGTGIGISNYADSPWTFAEFPHNSYLQMFAQTGIIGGLAFLAMLAAILARTWKGDRTMLLPLFCCLVGALFIPDILNSRFFPVLAAIGLAGVRHIPAPEAATKGGE